MRRTLGIVILVLLLAVVASAVPRYRAAPPVAGQSWASLPMGMNTISCPIFGGISQNMGSTSDGNMVQ